MPSKLHGGYLKVPERLLTDSEVAFERARRVMPGGVSSPVRAFGGVGGSPIFLAHGNGSHVTDVDGNDYIDLLSSWGPLILGHADPRVVQALRGAAGQGTSFGAPTERETMMAETIVDALPSVEMLRFVSSGTEAAMSAIRLARAATNRPMILKFAGCYHGHADSLMVGAGSGVLTLGLPDSPGVTAGAASDTLVAQYNNLDAVRDAARDFGTELAAVIVEPVAANMGVVAPSPGFLAGLREICDATGALLIFDEVVTGFRVGWSGAQGLYGIYPDLTILGKTIGGGLPVGAYGGSRRLMELVAPCGPVYQAGTLSGNPISLAAGEATLAALAERRFTVSGSEPIDAYSYLEMLGARLAAGLGIEAERAGVPVQVGRAGSMLTAFLNPGPVVDLESAKRSDTKGFARFFHHLLAEGVYWPPSQFEAAFVSTAHTIEDIDRVVEAAGKAFERIT
jgi:glutamate-1-semialdehyde 2,1-aminomutase